MKETELKLHPCHCGGEMKIEKVRKNGGMDGAYWDWELSCTKCGLTKTYAADDFYGREYKILEEVVDDWNKKSRNDLIVIKVKSGINVKADVMDHWCKEILKQKETGVIALPWFLDVVKVPEDAVDNKYPIYICDRDKSPCKNSAICYKPGGFFYTTDKDRALDPYMTVYKVERFKKVKEGDKNE